MKLDLISNFNIIQTHLKEYLNLRLQLVKLSVLEKVTKISVFITSLMVIILAVSIFFVFASAAFVVWYGSRTQDYLTGLLIVMGIVVFLMVIFFLLRRTIVESFFIKTFSSILLENDLDDE